MELNLGATRAEDVRGGGKSSDSSSRRSSRGPAKPTASDDTKKREQEAGLRARLTDVFGRIAEALEARGDEELAEAIREDTTAMSQGLVSLTNRVVFLRAPLAFGLALAAPVVAV